MAEAANPVVAYSPDPKKAEPFFKKAAETEKQKQYDYAVTMYVTGLQYDPDNVDRYKQLLNCARLRKAAGGKPGGGLFGETFSLKGAGVIIPLLNAVESYAKDPDNVAKLEKIVKATGASQTPKVAEFFADQLYAATKSESNVSVKKARYKMLKDLYKGYELFSKARAAAEAGLELEPNSLEMSTEIKNLAAMDVTKKGNYEKVQDGGSFRDSIKDWDKQKQAIQMQMDVKSDDVLDRNIRDTREKWMKEPANGGLLRAYAAALAAKEDDASENEAIKVCNENYRKLNDYGLRVVASNIEMKHKARHLRLMREKIAALPEAQRAEPQARYEAKAREVLLWEIAEYDERCNKYPTDKELRYEHGKRCLEAGSGGGAVTDMAMIDKAVDSLQLAVQNAKIKVKALDLQGTAFLLKGWFEEAVDAFKEAIEAYPGSNDDLSKRLHYNLGTAYEGLYSTNEGKKAADALEEALKEFRLVAGWQMTYKDVRDRIQKIRNAKAKAAAGS